MHNTNYIYGVVKFVPTYCSLRGSNLINSFHVRRKSLSPKYNYVLYAL